MNQKLQLEPGKFYKSKDGQIWCCYRVRKHPLGEHADCDCIRVSDSRTEYFYRDGRYDEAGVREHTLVREVPATEAVL